MAGKRRCGQMGGRRGEAGVYGPFPGRPENGKAVHYPVYCLSIHSLFPDGGDDPQGDRVCAVPAVIFQHDPSPGHFPYVPVCLGGGRQKESVGHIEEDRIRERADKDHRAQGIIVAVRSYYGGLVDVYLQYHRGAVHLRAYSGDGGGGAGGYICGVPDDLRVC